MTFQCAVSEMLVNMSVAHISTRSLITRIHGAFV